MTVLQDIISKRRTFAIISHPDAGKTTLTEKLLLFGGAIQMAGSVKAKKEKRAARSDWMKVEQERGISVSSSVMTFEYNGITYNLLDTPGHEDFSEDTYRVLTAVDSAIMVIDAAKGIETQTRKLFEVCRLRDIPIITFINKMDRDGKDSFELLEEIEKTLALDVCPRTWPIGMGRDFKGCYHLDKNVINFIGRQTDKSRLPDKIEKIDSLEDKKLETLLPSDQLQKLKDDITYVEALCPTFDEEAYLNGSLTPVYFGSAINNFGVKELLEGLEEISPCPKSQKSDKRLVLSDEEKVTGIVFKIQANMDAKHRDRIAFMRLCSGHFKRGQKLYHVQSNKIFTLNNATLFLAQERELAEEAYAGDIIGIPNHGTLSIGDTFTEGEKIRFKGIPSFAPELLQKVRAKDPLKSKHLGKALEQISEEGGASVFKPLLGSDFIVGVVGQLQFEILADRIRTEYEIDVIFEPTSFVAARWIEGDLNEVKTFAEKNRGVVAFDAKEHFVFLARNSWQISKTEEDNPKLSFVKVKEQGLES